MSSEIHLIGYCGVCRLPMMSGITLFSCTMDRTYVCLSTTSWSARFRQQVKTTNSWSHCTSRCVYFNSVYYPRGSYSKWNKKPNSMTDFTLYLEWLKYTQMFVYNIQCITLSLICVGPTLVEGTSNLLHVSRMAICLWIWKARCDICSLLNLFRQDVYE